MSDVALTTTKPQITVAYMRTATGNRRDARMSLERQHRACTDYADALGLRVSVVYFDIGASGLAEHRPALDQLMHDLSDGHISHVVVADPARLARSSELERGLQQRIRSEGATISSPCDGGRQRTGGKIDDTPCD